MKSFIGKKVADIKEIEEDRSNSEKLYSRLCKAIHLCEELDEIIEYTTDGIFITDGKGIALKINKAYEVITGLKREELLGKYAGLLVANQIVSVSSAVLAIKTRKSVTMEQTIFRTGKKVLISGSPILDSYGNVEKVIVTVRDITELELLKDKLFKKEEMFLKYKSEVEIIKAQLTKHKEIVAEDKKMLDIIYIAKKVANVEESVLLTGETGVGKEEIAKFIHSNGQRVNEHFIKVNCGAIPENLIESELFGYEGGAFTGAKTGGKPGLFEVADKGTIFLDEIGELPLNMQVKMLRVLQEREVERIGSVKPIKIDVRVISATNRNLNEMILKKQFREDLFYRLNVIPICIPPLRERHDDIIPLTNVFLKNINKKYELNKKISNLAYKTLLDYDWPGNVRELKNIVQRAVIMSNDDYITCDEIVPVINGGNRYLNETSKEQIDLKELLEKIEMDYINRSYDKYKNVRLSAKKLGMNASTFVRKRKEYNNKYL